MGSFVVLQVIEKDVYQHSRRVAVYLSMKDEVETADLLTHMFKSGKSCFIPRYDTSSRHMDMVKLHSIDEINQLPLTKWNIAQPEESDKRENALDTGM